MDLSLAGERENSHDRGRRLSALFRVFLGCPWQKTRLPVTHLVSGRNRRDDGVVVHTRLTADPHRFVLRSTVRQHKLVLETPESHLAAADAVSHSLAVVVWRQYLDK